MVLMIRFFARCAGNPHQLLSLDTIALFCPHCSHTLAPKNDRKFFRICKFVNPKRPYYLNNLKKVDKKHLSEPYGKSYYKLHYIYCEFTVDFFDMEISSLSKKLFISQILKA